MPRSRGRAAAAGGNNCAERSSGHDRTEEDEIVSLDPAHTPQSLSVADDRAGWDEL
jgi:hypothetical protein